MKKLLTTTAALVAFATAASAADMPLKAPPPAPVVLGWSGAYIGANVGYSWGPWDSTSTFVPNFPQGFVAHPQVDGWLGGAQVGYNWQRDKWVFGVEGDIQGTGERASDNGNTITTTHIPFAVIGLGSNPGCRVAGCDLTTVSTLANSWRLPWFSTLRARIGVTPEPTWLLYATGGLAIGETDYSNSSSGTVTLTSTATGAVLAGPTALPAASSSESQTRVGYSVGGGVEKMFSNKWSVKAEYLYIDFGSHTFLSGSGFDTNVRLRDNIFRIGVNYHFGEAVVARY
jgi:outer membrane immunogenic protein